ncbi:unnamed protein product [Eretmochelys imbricata]
MLPPLLLLPWAWGVLAGSPPLPRASVTLRLLQIDIFHNASSTDMVGTALLGDLETHSLDCSPCQIRFLQPWDPLVTQGSVGCELHPNGTSRGFDDAGVNGEDFVSFDADAGSWLTWRGDKLALYARDLLNRDKGPASKIQFLLRTWAPSPAGTPAPLLLVCRVTGFYPRPVRVAWLQDGEEVGPGGRLSSSGILPNVDLTYQLRSSLAVEPGDGHSYACRVEHSSLGGQSLLIPWGHSRGWGPGLAVGIALGVVAVAAVAVALWRSRRR